MPRKTIREMCETLDVEDILKIKGWWLTGNFAYNANHRPIYDLYRDLRDTGTDVAPKPKETMLKHWPPVTETERAHALSGFRQALDDLVAVRGRWNAYKNIPGHPGKHER